MNFLKKMQKMAKKNKQKKNIMMEDYDSITVGYYTKAKAKY